MLLKILLYICLFIFPFTSYAFDEKQLNRFKVIKICKKCDLTNSNIAKEELDDSILTNTNFSNSNLNKVNFEKSQFKNINFQESNLQNIKFNNSKMIN